MSRVGRALARISTAASNLAKLISGGWKRIPDQERKPIKRALLAIAVVIAIGGLGFLFLRVRPKRAFSALLSCQTIETPGPLETIVHYKARELRLWKYFGAVDGLSSSSMKSSAPSGASENLKLELSQIPGPEAQLRITVEGGAGQELALNSPAGSVVRLIPEASATPDSQGRKSLAQLEIETKRNAESTASWQVDGSAEMWHGGLNVKGIGDAAPSNMLSLVPVHESLIQFDFKSKEPGAKVLTAFPRGESPVVFRLQAPAEPKSFAFAKCNSKEVIFDGFVVVPVGDVQDVGFDRVTIRKVDLSLPDQEPRITAAIYGETHNISFDGYSKNPSRLVAILSSGWDTRSVFGVLALGLILLLGKVLNRAIDVLNLVIIPDPPEDKGTLTGGSEAKVIAQASPKQAEGSTAKGSNKEAASKPKDGGVVT